MSLVYSTLQAKVLAVAHRPALTVEVLDFIRQAEGRMRRNLRAFEYRYSLTDSDRASLGLYNLPTTVLEVRDFKNANDVSLENVGVQAIRQLSSSSDVLAYAISGEQVEFRGVPGTGYSIPMIYLGWPAELTNPNDTNIILQRHETIYLDGALGYLFEFSQDIELADRAWARCDEAIDELNDQYSRKTGGQSQRAGYNLGNVGTSTGY